MVPSSTKSNTSPVDALDDMSAQELTALIEAAEEKRREKLDAAKQDLVEEFRARAAELGLSMDDLPLQQQRRGRGEPAPSGSGRKQRSDAGTPRPVKYRGPNGEEWSGRGRTPNWLTALEAEGRGRDEFAV